MVKVNCWFCNNNSRVPYGNRNCFNCPHCEQYNGFDQVSAVEGIPESGQPPFCFSTLGSKLDVNRYFLEHTRKRTNVVSSIRLLTQADRWRALRRRKIPIYLQFTPQGGKTKWPPFAHLEIGPIFWSGL